MPPEKGGYNTNRWFASWQGLVDTEKRKSVREEHRGYVFLFLHDALPFFGVHEALPRCKPSIKIIASFLGGKMLGLVRAVPPTSNRWLGGLQHKLALVPPR